MADAGLVRFTGAAGSNSFVIISYGGLLLGADFHSVSEP